MKHKLIFLDIDGVLNYRGCNARSATGCLGIEDEKVKLLKQIVDQTGALIVLTSTWKTDWERGAFPEDLNKDGRYLVESLKRYHLAIYDKTIDPEWSLRGIGILKYIEQLPFVVDSFVIIDDEMFDFDDLCIEDHVVKTSFENGLLIEHVERAVNILNA